MRYLPEFAAGASLFAVLAAAIGFQGPPAGDAAATTPPTPTNSFAIADVRVFDGARVLPRATVIVREGLISAVGEGLPIPDDIELVDGRGKTVFPGLIDAHTHSWGDAQRDALRFGVTTELDMMGDWSRITGLRTQRESLARTDLADLWTAGAAVTAPGGHGTQYGMAVPTLDAGGDAAAFVQARVAEGSDYIKLIVEDMSVYGGTKRLPTLAPAQVGAAIDAAHDAGRLALVHASAQADARHAVQVGADGLVHIFQDAVADDAFVAAARSSGAFVVPTLSVVAMIAGVDEGSRLALDPKLAPWLSTEQVGSLKGSFGGPPRAQLLQHALDSVRALHTAGVPLLAGTDAGNPGTTHGAGLHGEMALLVRAGLTPSEALAAATALPAQRFGLKDRGRIATGLRADLVLVDGDPTHDIAASRAIVAVWKNGYPVPRRMSQPAAAAATLDAHGLVSDFDDGGTGVRFGSGWQPTTDQMAGGASTVSQQWVEGGAQGSRGALQVSGEVLPGFAYPWAGTMFFPAPEPMQPVDASARKELVFQVRGDGRQYSAMLFSGASAQAMPSIRTFNADAQWREVRLALADFTGADLSQLRGIAFTAGQPRGRFEFMLDHVELR
jgi:imidazolonepropionase-like amidohydrolase